MPSPTQTADAIARLGSTVGTVKSNKVVEIHAFKTRSAVVRHLLPQEELSNEENDSP
jgi:hypothetical protein